MKIKPYDSKIQRMFQSIFFKIPRFQRPYSWDKGNIEDFWSDVIASGKKDHFIGSMVFYTEGNDQELYIVDGQQRLTTITIFLAALRDVLAECNEENLSDGIQGIIERPDIGAKKRYVLLTETSYPYLQEYIQKKGEPEIDITPSDEELGIKTAYEFARASFSEIVDSIQLDASSAKPAEGRVRARLESCRDALLSLDVIVVQLENENDAHVVFETLNTRGRDLEPKDLVKNLLTKFLPPKSGDVDPAKIKWNKMVHDISSSSVTLDASTYLHHFWLSRFDYTPERTLYEKIKLHLNKANSSKFLDDIINDVECYRRIFEPDEFEWSNEEEALKKSLQALNIFKMRQPTPFILSVLHQYYAKVISLKQARDALGVVERFHFAYTAIAGQSSSGGVSKMYAAAGRGLSTDATSQKRATHLQEFRTKLTAKFPDDKKFVAGFSDLRFSQRETRQRPLIRYVLQEIDLSMRQGVAIDYPKMTIEHIAPQNPKLSKATQQYDSIGNLILVSESLNLKLQNKPFLEKKKLLVQAAVPLDAVLNDATTWGNAEIEARTELLATIAYTRSRKT